MKVCDIISTYTSGFLRLNQKKNILLYCFEPNNFFLCWKRKIWKYHNRTIIKLYCFQTEKMYCNNYFVDALLFWFSYSAFICGEVIGHQYLDMNVWYMKRDATKNLRWILKKVVCLAAPPKSVMGATNLAPNFDMEDFS